MNIEKMRADFELAFVQEIGIDLRANRYTDDEGLDCYQFGGDDADERSKLASIAFMFWRRSRESLVVELPKISYCQNPDPGTDREVLERSACKKMLDAHGIRWS